MSLCTSPPKLPNGFPLNLALRVYTKLTGLYRLMYAWPLRYIS